MMGARLAAVLLSLTITAGAVCATVSEVAATANVGATVGYDTPELPNPLRGQHENLLEPLFPQSNPAQSSYPAWPGTFDRSGRVDWKTLQPVDPRTLPADAPDTQRYDFAIIDRELANAAAQHRRLAFRVTAFNSCCAASYPNNVNASVPDWLRSLPGATTEHVKGFVRHVVPDWNNDTYLEHVTRLIAALGARYDNDERLAWFEFSGYGDFSENHVAFMRDTLGKPGPTGEDSLRQLGYYSQIADQYITKPALVRLVAAHLSAFRNTRIVTAPGNAEITRQLFTDHALLAGRATAVGNRSDCLGTFGAVPWWAADPSSYYVVGNDPIVAVLRDRWRYAPVVTEWCNFRQTTVQQYYEKGLKDVVNEHISVLSSTGFPDQHASSTMSATYYALWSKANKFSGYRYAMSAAAVPDAVVAGAALPVSVNWTNFGAAPVYENWRPEYELRDRAGTAVRTVAAGVDLKSVVSDQNYTNTAATPASRTVADNLALDTVGLAPGTYTLVGRVRWHEHKPAGTNVVDFAPLALAQTGRDGTGAYPIGTFTVTSSAPSLPTTVVSTSAPATPPSSAVSTTTSPSTTVATTSPTAASTPTATPSVPKTTTSPPPVSSFEAEASTWTPAAAAGVYADSSASGGSALGLWGNATATLTSTLPTATALKVRAMGAQCFGWPTLRVSVDGVVLGTKNVNTTRWSDYSFPVSLAAGNHTIAVAFVNDYAGFCDRNLMIDKITVTPK